jgi:hypothetical protein
MELGLDVYLNLLDKVADERQLLKKFLMLTIVLIV